MQRFFTAWFSLLVVGGRLPAAEPLSYNRDVRPILSDNCFACHGPDSANRKAGLRLDQRDEALKPAESGDRAIVPGKPEDSALAARIFSPDADDVMPPPKAHKKLDASQKATLKRWISEGAVYEKHWAYLSVKPVRVPTASDVGTKDAELLKWPRNPIDWFILKKLVSVGLAPSRQADTQTLARRMALDLTGLPLTTSDSTSPAQLFDRLVHSPHYGERMAVDWLDAARYADTNGYQVDRDRELWPWRDWVIRAFNRNKPFDQFTIEQLAGDLLPEATLEQKIATGFHRNHMLNEEGGVLADEFLAEYTADRVETTAAVWLGQTFTCARCHDHKFDAITQRDYYSMKAFFHNIPEKGVGIYSNPIRTNAPPFVSIVESPKLEKEFEQLSLEVKNLQARVRERKEVRPEQKKLSDQLAASKKRLAELEQQIPTTLVMEEMKEPRPTFVLMRGVYDKPGEQVAAATPAALPTLSEGLPRNRLGLARWLVSSENPLTARVTINRLWQSIFGTGLVRTSEDFGSQGEAPSHPELLDWLAGEFMRSGWDIQHMLRLMMMSATYQQSSEFTGKSARLDPDNRLLSRGLRFRMNAEFVRDQALAASGLLSERIGGRSVKPFHPPGVYELVTSGNGTNVYVEGKGEDLHRRSLYTYWKRSVPHPAMIAFDVPGREVCTLRRTRSNTPMQALNLMNDPTYIEAARALAMRMLASATELSRQIQFGYRCLLARDASAAEVAVLSRAFQRNRDLFAKDNKAATGLLKAGPSFADARVDVPTLAAMTSVASTMLCLDETITKE